MPVFDLTLLLTGTSSITDEIANQLFEAGCDDATLCATSNRVTLVFSRSASDFEAAISSALQDVRTAGFEATPLPTADWPDL